MQATFAERVAFVTGAGTGIGRATAIAFTQGGAKVALVGIDAEELEETHKLIEVAGGETVAIVADTLKSEQQHKAPLAEMAACPQQIEDRI